MKRGAYVLDTSRKPVVTNLAFPLLVFRDIEPINALEGKAAQDFRFDESGDRDPTLSAYGAVLEKPPHEIKRRESRRK